MTIDHTTSAIAIHLDADCNSILNAAMASVGGFILVGTFHQYFGEKDATLVRAVREHKPDVCVIDFDSHREMAMETVEYLRRSTMGTMAIFAVSSSMESESIIGAMRCGCTEYLTKPLQVERLKEALLQLSRKKRDVMAPPIQGKVITLMGTKGGVGVTTLTVHLAYCLAKAEHRTLLIDKHPDLGDITLHLGLEHHNYGFYELVQNLQRLDAELLQGFVLKHESGLDLLPSPEALGSAPHITPDAVLLTLRALARMYDYIVVDCGTGLSELNMAVLDATDELYIISTPELPGVRNMARYLDYLSRLNYPSSKIYIVINRSAKNSSISAEHIERVLQRKISLMVPNSYSEVAGAIGTGVPISLKSKSDFMQSLIRWSGKVAGQVEGGTVKTDSRAYDTKSRQSTSRIYG